MYQIIEDSTAGIRKKVSPYIGAKEGTAFQKILRKTCTFLFVTIAWIFFRTGLRGAVRYIIAMVSIPSVRHMINGELWELGLSPFWWFLLIVCTAFVVLIDSVYYKREIRIEKLLNSQGALAKAIIIILLSLTILILGVYGDQHDASFFVYSQF